MRPLPASARRSSGWNGRLGVGPALSRLLVLAGRSSFGGPDSEFLLDFLKGVSGGTASGKTTVCDMIIQQLHDHRVMLVNQVCFSSCSSDLTMFLCFCVVMILLCLWLVLYCGSAIDAFVWQTVVVCLFCECFLK